MPPQLANQTCGICGNFDGVENELAMGPHVVGNSPYCQVLAAAGPQGDQVRSTQTLAQEAHGFQVCQLKCIKCITVQPGAIT